MKVREAEGMGDGKRDENGMEKGIGEMKVGSGERKDGNESNGWGDSRSVREEVGDYEEMGWYKVDWEKGL